MLTEENCRVPTGKWGEEKCEWLQRVALNPAVLPDKDRRAMLAALKASDLAEDACRAGNEKARSHWDPIGPMQVSSMSCSPP